MTRNVISTEATQESRKVSYLWELVHY